MTPSPVLVRPLHPGMGQAVAERTVLRPRLTEACLKRVGPELRLSPRDPNYFDWLRAGYYSGLKIVDDFSAPQIGKPETEYETWGEVALRVALGNVKLVKSGPGRRDSNDFRLLKDHIAKATILMSGRHLQHGDVSQPERNMEVFINCATSCTRFNTFGLLLNGSGVGTDYSDDMILCDLDYAPQLRCVLSDQHPDFIWGRHESVRDALHKYGKGRNVVWHKVEDSREGWAKAVEIYEVMAFERVHAHKTLILDFSDVRPKGAPIKGMQMRPSSGPAPLIDAFANVATLKGLGLDPWHQAIYADHYLAECVLVGGARRAARMSTKYWKDRNVLDFIEVKRPVEYQGLTNAEVLDFRAEWKERFKRGEVFMPNPPAFLWSSNNSVTVDEEFWTYVRASDELVNSLPKRTRELAIHAKKVFQRAVECAYYDGTGEPGFINVDRLTTKNDGWDYEHVSFVGSEKYQVEGRTRLYLSLLAKAAHARPYPMITNPCVTADTWVMTGDGPRQVAELIDRPFTAIVDGKPYAATGFWKTGDKPVFKVTTDRGYEVRATDNHKLLVETSRRRRGGAGAGHAVETDWVEVKDLQPGDVLVLSNHSGVAHWGGDGTFNEGWLIGQMVGDGGYNPDSYAGYLRFWGPFMSERAARAQEMVKALLFSSHRPAALGPVRKANEANGSVTVSSRALDELAAGLIEPGTKRLLLALERRSAAFYMGFLRGFFDADGSVQGTAQKGVSVRLAQSNLERLRVIQRMLARFGIVATIYENRRDHCRREMPDGKGGTALYDCLPQHELVISRDNIVRFAEIVGFSDDVKQTRLAEVLGDRKRPIYRDRFTAEVVSIEPDGVEAVYDCTVETVHRFDANGIVTHNCGEIALTVLGGYCTIADVVPYHADTLDEAEDAFRVSVRALMRVNTMDCLYKREVERTNRIGVGMTGVHEFAFKFFRLGFRDLVSLTGKQIRQRAAEVAALLNTRATAEIVEHLRASDLDSDRTVAFWLTMARFSRAVKSEAAAYAAELGVTVPHTDTTMKPAGTTSKLFGLTEGWHLPPFAEYLRWVQFKENDPLVAEYEAKGYPIRRNLKQYRGMVIVAFPTVPTIATLGMGDKLVLAGEATPEEQYKWLMLGEEFYIRGIDEDLEDLPESGNQISYTLKYNPDVVSFEQFRETILDYQSQVRACSVMPQEDGSAYEYLPEEAVTKAEFEAIARAIQAPVQEDINFAHLDCGTGGCPVDFVEEKA